jgi:hypothetical protein
VYTAGNVWSRSAISSFTRTVPLHGIKRKEYPIKRELKEIKYAVSTQ